MQVSSCRSGPLSAALREEQSRCLQSRSDALTGTMGARRAWTVSMISALSMPWRYLQSIDTEQIIRRARRRGRLAPQRCARGRTVVRESSRASASRTEPNTSLDSLTHATMRGSRPGLGRDFVMARRSNYFTRFRSAVTGRFVKRGRAKSSPRTTVTERFRRSTGKKAGNKKR